MSILDITEPIEETKNQDQNQSETLLVTNVQIPELNDLFGKDEPNAKININILNSLKKNKIFRNNVEYWPYQMDNEMHLNGISFEEAQLLT